MMPPKKLFPMTQIKVIKPLYDTYAIDTLFIVSDFGNSVNLTWQVDNNYVRQFSSANIPSAVSLQIMYAPVTSFTTSLSQQMFTNTGNTPKTYSDILQCNQLGGEYLPIAVRHMIKKAPAYLQTYTVYKYDDILYQSKNDPPIMLPAFTVLLTSISNIATEQIAEVKTAITYSLVKEILSNLPSVNQEEKQRLYNYYHYVLFYEEL